MHNIAYIFCAASILPLAEHDWLK